MSPTQALDTSVKVLSFEDYLTYDDASGRRYELLDTGELAELSCENDLNVLLAMALAEYLKQFISWRLLRLNTCAVQVTPTTVNLPNGRKRRVRQQSRIPDLMVLTTQGAQQIAGKPSGLALHHDNPSLVVEFVSESNAEDDYIDKRSQYESRGIFEYWIVDRHRQQVVVCVLESGVYVETLYQNNDQIKSQTFPEITLTAKNVFAEISS